MTLLAWLLMAGWLSFPVHTLEDLPSPPKPRVQDDLPGPPKPRPIVQEDFPGPPKP